jgi:hypothetical protein
MNKLAKPIIFIFLFAGMLVACRNLAVTPVATQVEATGTTLATSLPPSPNPPAATTTPVSERIVFYYFVPLTGAALPEGSVVIMPETYILAPERSESAHTPDTAADLRTALDYALNDARNGWTSTELEILVISFKDGHANIILQGEYFGVGDVTLIAAKMQLLLTVFANPAVQSATVTLNDDTIGNLGVSNSMYAYPADYAFTRAEIEAFLAENLYGLP